MKVNGRCAYKGECYRCCVVYKVTCKFCDDFYVVDTQNTLKIMEQHFQDVAQKVMHDNNLEYFSAHFAKKNTKNEPTTIL